MTSATVSPPLPVPADATCPRHGAPAIAACRRCGTFVCVSDQVVLENAIFCSGCAARPDVDYLEAFRQKYWGKRDAWTWFFGFAALVSMVAALGYLAEAVSDFEPRAAVLGAALLAWGVTAGAFWWGALWSRPALLVVVLLHAAVQTFTLGPAGLGGLIFPLAFVASALSNVRTKLFFRMEVTRAELKKTWSVLHDNVIARSAVMLGVAGMFIGVFAPLAVLLGIIGLRRVDATAYPPIGRKGQAITAIVLGALGTLGWGAFAVKVYLDSR